MSPRLRSNMGFFLLSVGGAIVVAVAGWRHALVRTASEEKRVPEIHVAPVPVAAATSGRIELNVVKLREAAAEPLISNGIPFAPGQLKSEKNLSFIHGGKELAIATKVLARWPQDGSIRSLLVQFRLPIRQFQEPVTMTWGQARTSPDLALIPVQWEAPEAVAQLPARWLCESQVIGEQVPMYAHGFPQYDERIMQYYPRRRDDPRNEDIREDGYYSSAHAFYQLYVRSGDPDIFLAARNEAIYYRDHEMLHEGPNRGRHRTYSETRYIYVDAMVDDYLLSGDERSRAAAQEMAEYLKRRYTPSMAFYPKGATTFWTEREAAFPFLGLLAYYGLSGERSYLAAADQIMSNLYKTQQQWPGRGGFIHNLYAHDPAEYARPDEYGGSPFMTGLLLEAVVEYHRLTGSEIAAQSLFLALDWLMNEALAPDRTTFLYMTADYYRGAPGLPDLNLLIAHAFGYGYKISGYTRTDYLKLGEQVFRRGITDAYLEDRKHFNQNLRSSGHFLAYIAGGLGAASDHQAASSSGSGDALYATDFEGALDVWTSPLPGTSVERDSSVAYSGKSSLAIKSTAPESQLSTLRQFYDWDLSRYPALRFAYKIPRGVPVGMRCQTEYGDWIYLGGTASQPRDGAQTQTAPVLVDDNQWHEARIDVGQAVRAVVPGVKVLKEFQYVNSQKASAQGTFWIDMFSIAR